MKEIGKKRDSDFRFQGRLQPELSGLRWKLAKILFSRAELDEDAVSLLNEYSEKGAVVIASHESSNFALLMIQSVLSKAGVKNLDFALEYNPIVLQSFSYIFGRIMMWVKRTLFRRKYPNVYETDYIKNLLLEKRGVLFSMLSRKFFLKRYVESKYDTILYLIRLQRSLPFPIFIMPEIIFWNRNPERTNQFVPTPPATGNRFFFLNLVSQATPSYIKFLKPVSLAEELEKFKEFSDEKCAKMIRQNILEYMQKHKRIVLGPVLRSRNEIAEKVLYHENVIKTAEEVSREDNIPLRRLKGRAFKYFSEIAADFSIVYIKIFERTIDLIFKKIFSGIVCDAESIARLKEAAERGPLVLTPCHKSHMDYMILSYICYKNKITLPHIAAGVNLSFFPMGTIFRHSGAFFIRRTFKGKKLYTSVFKQYLKTLVADSYLLEFFVEGGRTRTGRLVFPKMGIINYLVEAIDENYNKDLIFLPISINYDRVPEESSYIKELRGKTKKRESVGSVIKGGSILSKDHGKVYVSVAEAFTLKEVESAGFKDDQRVEEIGYRIISGIYSVTSVTPVALVTAPMLMMAIRGFTRKDLLRNVFLFHEYLAFTGAFFSDTTRDKKNINEIFEYAVNLFVKEKFIDKLRYDERESSEDFFVIKTEARTALSFYKNSIAHFSLDISMICASLLVLKNKLQIITVEDIEVKIDFLKNLISKEYLIRYGFDEISEKINGIIEGFLIPKNFIKAKDGGFVISEESIQDIVFFARGIQDVLESYFASCGAVADIPSDAISSKDIMTAVRKYGISLYHTEKTRAPESLSQPNYNNSLKKLSEYGFIKEFQDDKKGSYYKIMKKASVKNLKDKIEHFVNALK
ncbi:MAG TPA: 1-acyl-sn-glycerol-3-phosphate acyltransferase [Spirochaetota bacterium]|nr:1-acyl-sn-glycerol-3-phosphate acyltransferase [Spirochaetota bacterium]HOR44307.1 1-acyl-sn-glycerol-3-phosphate acyltransferase [Spirochaetota bacterium]HOU84654.1 1-acyl-sn-glycerol-3-phosphate acyltransferase [Spirochaetota bacterium]HPK55787.1 1-acyl-sn-glycerol-3-phosphate acyltransferase [Spirochaetota bacterium]HQE57793.1 1-acyl-sn-glycerol-3-phosphate acyltransferase [Spirochaetota bacterium]